MRDCIITNVSTTQSRLYVIDESKLVGNGTCLLFVNCLSKMYIYIYICFHKSIKRNVRYDSVYLYF